ncbi:MAG TPA: hypothetical protein VHX61_19170 [Rhizomicrobium sp.]|jgi:hypothetical protein|nr:hypothetical protein [Rhizomicrobium sp.]
MIAISPSKTKYRRELGYAESNLCSIALRQPYDRSGAMQHCATALAVTKAAASHPDGESYNPDTRKSIDSDVMNCFGNMADAYKISGAMAKALAERQIELAILNRQLAADPNNMDLKDTWIALQIAFAELYRDSGRDDVARTTLANAFISADALHRFDPNNRRSKQQRDYIANELKEWRSQ